MKNNGNIVKFSICPIESIFDLVRQVFDRVNYFSRTSSPGFLELALDFLCNVFLDLISGMMTW